MFADPALSPDRVPTTEPSGTVIRSSSLGQGRAGGVGTGGVGSWLYPDGQATSIGRPVGMSTWAATDSLSMSVGHWTPNDLACCGGVVR